MNQNASKYIQELQQRGPARWATGAHGWIDTDGQPVTLEAWQIAALDAWYQHRQDVSTLALSNIKKTGKTFLNSVLLAWRWLALPGVHFVCGNDLDQSKARQFDEIAAMVERNPFLRENVKASKMELEFTLTGSKLLALAADATGNAGSNHLTASHTESWGILYENGIRAYEELTPPPGFTYGLPAMRILDSYAGFIGESQTWHKLVDRGLTGERISEDWPIYKIGGLLLFHMEGIEAQERCFRGSEAQRIDYYNEQGESMRPHAYQRMHENRRTSGESAFVTTEQWEACYSMDVRPLAPAEDVRLFFGADASQKHDYTALIGTSREDYTDVRYVKIWKPKKGLFGKVQPIDLEETIGAELLRLHTAGQVRAVCFDPWQLATVAKQWEKKGIKTIEMPQTDQRTEADTALFNAIVSGSLRHYKNAELDDAVHNAIVIEKPRGLRIAKEKASKKIDALVALSMSHHAAITSPVLGNIQSMSNFLYDGTDVEDYIEIEGQFVYAPGNTARAHPQGTTWRNCKRRKKGCEACVYELAIEGVYAAQDAQLAADRARGGDFPMTEAEYYQEMAARRGATLAELERPTEQRIVDTFWKAVRKKL